MPWARRQRARRCALTLIELLVVVAIVAVLAAMALPNLIAAQTRARLARVRADQRTLAAALEAYRLDTGAYPSAESNGTLKWLVWMTTPVAYLTDVYREDPFTGRGADPDDLATLVAYPYYRYYGFNEMGYLNARSATGEVLGVYSPPGELRVKCFVLFSHGPDRIRSRAPDGTTFLQASNLFNPARFIDFLYDPTNGAASGGELLRVGGEPLGRAAPALRLAQ